MLACGQGFEGCAFGNHNPIDQSVVDQCKNDDPRGAWRGLALAVDFDGNIDWYRMDSFGPNPKGVQQCLDEGESIAECNSVGTSAYEWVSYDPSDPRTLVFFSDEGMGFAYSTMDLTTRDFNKQ